VQSLLHILKSNIIGAELLACLTRQRDMPITFGLWSELGMAQSVVNCIKHVGRNAHATPATRVLLCRESRGTLPRAPITCGHLICIPLLLEVIESILRLHALEVVELCHSYVSTTPARVNLVKQVCVRLAAWHCVNCPLANEIGGGTFEDRLSALIIRILYLAC